MGRRLVPLFTLHFSCSFCPWRSQAVGPPFVHLPAVLTGRRMEILVARAWLFLEAHDDGGWFASHCPSHPTVCLPLLGGGSSCLANRAPYGTDIQAPAPRAAAMKEVVPTDDLFPPHLPPRLQWHEAAACGEKGGRRYEAVWMRVGRRRVRVCGCRVGSGRAVFFPSLFPPRHLARSNKGRGVTYRRTHHPPVVQCNDAPPANSGPQSLLAQYDAALASGL